MTLVLRGISILTLIVGVPAELHVRSTGIGNVDRLDVGMVFYVEIENAGKLPIALATRMINCCENITPEDIDCEHIQLIGGDMGVLNPHCVRNLTLVWPTLYLHERKGECNIAISYGCRNNQTDEIEAKVRFDTSVSTNKVPAVLEGYYEPIIVKKCPSVDLDPLDHCRPINCHVKYNGKRNFYNRKLQRCQPVPLCFADAGKELPDVAYVPVSNSCRDLENAVNEMEIRALKRGEAEPAWASEPAPRLMAYVPVSNSCRDLENAVNEMEIRALKRGEAEPAWASEPAPRLMNMYCHRGYNDNATGFCICDDGWTSQPLKNVEPSNEYIHMCNVQTTKYSNLHGRPAELLLYAIAAFLATLVVFFCCTMTFVVRGFIPSGTRVDCAQQTGSLACCDSSSKSLSCSSSNNNRKRRKMGNRSSATSCRGNSFPRLN